MGKSDVPVYSALPRRQTSRPPSKALVTRNDNKVHHDVDHHPIQNANGDELIEESNKDEAQCFPCQCPILSKATRRVTLSSMKATPFGNNSINRPEVAHRAGPQCAIPLDRMPVVPGQGSRQPIASSSAMDIPTTGTAPLKSKDDGGTSYNQNIKNASVAQSNVCDFEVRASQP